jgi:hypothetical protein
VRGPGSGRRLHALFFIDWHKRPEIQIFCEKSRRSDLGGSETPNLIFHFTNSYPLTSIEVVEAEDARTNKYPHALWHVVAAAAPVPTTSFGYGAAIPGMKPEISTACRSHWKPTRKSTLAGRGRQGSQGQNKLSKIAGMRSRLRLRLARVMDFSASV